MAQLVKLIDYVTRYEVQPFHYPSQYIRLKQENWQQLLLRWELESDMLDDVAEEVVTLNETERMDRVEKKKGLFNWSFFQKKKYEEKKKPFVERTLPYGKNQLVQHFLNDLFPFQLKWATSTITHVSFTDRSHQYDRLLKSFLQRLPDIYLLMYYPVFNIQQAPVEGEIILISPIGIEVLTVVEESCDSTVFVRNERTWHTEGQGIEKKIISPMIALKRTEQIVRSVLNHYDVNIRVTKTIISEQNNFVYDTKPYQTNIVGKDDFDKWLEKKKALHSPLKNVQLKAMEALLKQCQTTSIRRPEWEVEDADYQTVGNYEPKVD